MSTNARASVLVWASRPPQPEPRLSRLRSALSAVLAVLLVATAAGTASADSDGEGTVPGRVLVQFADDAPSQAAERVRDGAGAEVVNRVGPLGVEVWRVPDHAAQRVAAALERNPLVNYAEPERMVELEDEVIPNDPEFDRQWGLTTVEAPTAWTSSKGESVTIAILDTGVNPVDDLAERLLPGHNVLDGSADTSDNHGHGTMSAGVAAAETDNGLDVAGYCWGCSLLPVKVLDEGAGYMSDLAAGIVWAADNGADVISMSLSGPSGSTTVRNAAQYAQDRDVTLVAAAGNQGDTAKRYPAAYDEVIAVAGTRSDDTLYSWSNHGPWVDVAAPGANRTTHPDGGTFTYGGTSSAAPAVAGVLGLARATGASADESRAALQDGAVAMDEIDHGRIDAAATLSGLGEAEPEPEPEPEPNIDPVADFTAECDELACDFDASDSYDEDGHITSYVWDFGDGTSGTGELASHTFDADGTYPVELVVTDDDGASDDKVVEVQVVTDDDGDESDEPEPEPEDEIELDITTSKSRGLVTAHLSWDGTEGDTVDIRVDGALHTTVADTDEYSHDTGRRGNPTITYEVCDSERCSDPVTVSSW